MRVVLWTVTLLRVVLIPIFLVLASEAQEIARAGDDPERLRMAVIGILAAMGISDVVDGWIARRYELATQIGAIVDAAADKLIQVTLIAFFTVVSGPAYAALPVWFLSLLVGRDVLLGGGLALAKARGVPMRVVHRPHGRASSILVFVILGWITIGLPPAGLAWLLRGGATLIVASTAAYTATGVRQARRAPSPAS